MSINNPYVPGDPYSYDLKWIVEKLKEAIALYTPISQEVNDLYEFVHNYFQGDVFEAQLDAALRVLASDGTLSDLIQPLFDEYKIDIDAEVANMILRIDNQDDEITTLIARMDTFASLPPGSTAGNAELLDIRVGYEGTTWPTAGDAVRGQVKDVEMKIDQIAADFNDLNIYLYKQDYYMNAGTETALVGYNIYKIPIENGDVLTLSYDYSNPFWSGLSTAYIACYEDTDNTFTNALPNSGQANYYQNLLDSQSTFLGYSTSAYLYLNIKADKITTVTMKKNKTSPALVNDVKAVDVFDANYTGETLVNQAYLNANNLFSRLNAPYFVMKFPVKTGDRLVFKNTITGLSFRGSIRESDGSWTSIANTDVTYDVLSDGVCFLFGNSSADYAITYIKADSIYVLASHVIGQINTDYDSLNGVAFGTSLTYRALTTGGYLQYLPSLSGASFDNQGIGSATMMSGILSAVRAYTDYGTKQLALLEGCVNDWYTDLPLGNWDDTGETSVCGCVRAAINYMLSQNANMTVFLILDPYGRSYSGIDCSSTAVNGNGLTQYEYYEEIAKVGESLGIPVIKEYAISGISENTPQYFLDNIHPNALGAEQSARVIWSQMRQYMPNI